MISVTVVGRIGKDGEMRQAGQTSVCSFSMAAEKTKKDDQGKPLVDWISVDIWGKRGEALCQYLKKGGMVAVSGRLEIDTFTKQDGVVVQKPTVNAQDVKLLGSPPQANGQAAPQQQRIAPPPVPVAPPKASDFDAIFSDESVIPF